MISRRMDVAAKNTPSLRSFFIETRGQDQSSSLALPGQDFTGREYPVMLMELHLRRKQTRSANAGTWESTYVGSQSSLRRPIPDFLEVFHAASCATLLDSLWRTCYKK